MNYYEFAGRLFEYLSNNTDYTDAAMYYRGDYFKLFVREKHNQDNNTNRLYVKVYRDDITSMDYEKEAEDLDLFFLFNQAIE